MVKFAQRMADDPMVRSEVEELMKVKSMVRELPTVTPPRNYILTRAMAEEARPKPFWERLFPVFRTAAAFCALAIKEGFIPPTINYETPDPECDLDYTPNVGVAKEIRAAVSTSLGFGGHNGVLVFKKA